MSGTRSARASTNGSLMQDVPGAFPQSSTLETHHDPEEPTQFRSLSEAVYARRSEYVRPTNIRIKVGTWNVAAHKGAEKDVGDWFVGGKGVVERLAGLNVKGHMDTSSNDDTRGEESNHEVEAVESQEARYKEAESSLPKNDPGSEIPDKEDIGLYVLGLQEVVDITSATEALRPYTDPAAAKRWKDAMSAALPEDYTLVAEQQLIGLLLLIYAAPSVSSDVRSVSTTSVGTGLMGYMGNKGAVTARIVLGETTRLVFVNSHLAAGSDKTSLERRNWDAKQIMQRTRFEPIQDAMDLSQVTGEQIGDEDFAFWFGDLNYRLESIPGDDVRRLLMLHTRNEYDLSQRSARKIDEAIEDATRSSKSRREHRFSADSTSSLQTASPRSSEDTQASTVNTAPSTIIDEISAKEDPTSLQTTLSSLLPHDELHQQMKTRKAFHDGWQEGAIAFLPTYKYDVGSVGVFDTSEKKRAPSWCDRILYRTRKDRLAYEAAIQDQTNARKLDEEMKANGTDQAGTDEEILYEYDPEADGTNVNDDYDGYDEYDDAEDGVVITKQGFEDEMQLEYYTAHQRVLSSDHKPLNAVFLLKYDAVVPELRTSIQADAAKEMDKAENEGRPSVTVVIDSHKGTQSEQSSESCGDFEGVWFGGVRWGQAKHRNMTIANTGRVVAHLNFLDRSPTGEPTSGIAPSWLNLRMDIDPDMGSTTTAVAPVVLEPGDTITVELEIRILDITLVRALNEGSKHLDDVLVLRVEGGRDHFIPVKAKWLETSLGRSIDKLIRIPEGGIRKLQSQIPDSSKTGHKPASPKELGSSEATVEDKSTRDEEPVRFSAPRELFRLTEAIEDLGSRIVAEFSMTSGDDLKSAPWAGHPAWPFDAECWTERSTAQWQIAVSEACNALDTDEPLENSIPSDVPRLQRLYILADLLLLLLRSMPDGVIDENLWSQLELYLAENEKSKRKSTPEERRTAIQEILSQTPSHSIPFVLIMTMLERLQSEIAGTENGGDGQPMSPTSPTSTQRNPLRKMTGLGRAPSQSRRSYSAKTLARVFANAMVRTPSGTEKTKGSKERWKTEILEVFLDDS